MFILSGIKDKLSEKSELNLKFKEMCDDID